MDLPLPLPSLAAAESSPLRIFAGPPTVRGVADGSSTTARGAWGGRQRGLFFRFSLDISSKLRKLNAHLHSRLSYLGHVISPNGVATDEEKIQAVQMWPTPTSVKELRSFFRFGGILSEICSPFRYSQ